MNNESNKLLNDLILQNLLMVFLQFLGSKSSTNPKSRLFTRLAGGAYFSEFGEAT